MRLLAALGVLSSSACRCGLGPARRLQGLLGEHVLAGLVQVVGPYPQGVAHALAQAPREAEGRHLARRRSSGAAAPRQDGQPQAHGENQGQGPGCLSRCEEGANAHDGVPSLPTKLSRCSPDARRRQRARSAPNLSSSTLSTSRQDFHPLSLNILLTETLGKT